MKISLIHPSRGRAAKSFMNHADWIAKARGADIETIVAVDHSDPTQADYIAMYAGMCYVGQHDTVVGATNAAAGRSKGDILIYLSDDFKAPDNWVELVTNEFEGVTEPRLIKVDDMYQKFHIPVLTIPIMNRALYNKLGYFFFPGYRSMHCDEDLYWTVKKLNALKLCEHLKFEHMHPAANKGQDDETYRRSAANWDQGKALFAKRKAAGFPL